MGDAKSARCDKNYFNELLNSPRSNQSRSLDLDPYTAMQPFKQSGTMLFAASGTNTWLLCGLTATECAVPAGKTFALPPTFIVGTTCTRLWLRASITPSTGPPGLFRAAR